jgi:hypothetical protein
MVEVAAQNREVVTASVQSGYLTGSTPLLITADVDGQKVNMCAYSPPPASF